MTLAAVAAFQRRDPLTASGAWSSSSSGCRRGKYAASLEAEPVGVPSRGTSRSAVSWTPIGRTWAKGPRS